MQAPHADRKRPVRRYPGRHAKSVRSIGAAGRRLQAIGNQLVTQRGYRLVNDQSEDVAMEKRKTVEATDGEAAANPDHASEQPQPKIELPAVESPPISPAEIVGVAKSVEPADATAAHRESLAASAKKSVSAAILKITAPKRPRFNLRPRHKRHAVLAASVLIAAAFGAIAGAATSGGFARPAAVDVAAVEENKAMQQSVARLTKEVTGLKASLEAANKSATSQIAKISERLKRESASVTGSVSPPQTVQPAPQASPPLPAPRPETAAAEPQPPRLTIVPDWSIRETRDGFVYVQGYGDIYQVVPGAPLPGLGPVEQIKRQDGRWLVVTPKGIIVSMRDRRYFEQF